MIFTTGVVQTTNFKPLIGAPLDNRTVIETRNDLISANMWQVSSGGTIVDLRYTGMVVAVQTGVTGLYWLDNLANRDKLWATQPLNDKKGWRRLIFEGENNSTTQWMVKADSSIIRLMNSATTDSSRIKLYSPDSSILFTSKFSSEQEDLNNQREIEEGTTYIPIRINPDSLNAVSNFKQEITSGKFTSLEILQYNTSTSLADNTNLEVGTEYVNIKSSVVLSTSEKSHNIRLIQGNGIKLSTYSGNNRDIIISCAENGNYILPAATTSTLGGIIVGAGLSITIGNSSTDINKYVRGGVLSVPIATKSARGAIIVGSGLDIDSNGKLFVLNSAVNNTLSFANPRILLSSSGGTSASSHPIELKNNSTILSSINIQSGQYIKLSQSGNTLIISYDKDWKSGAALQEELSASLELRHTNSKSVILTLINEEKKVQNAVLFEAGEGIEFEYDTKVNPYTDIPAELLSSIKIKLKDSSIIKNIITTEVGEGITITPNGEVSVEEGGSKTFNIIAAPGYIINKVLIDGIADDTLVGKSNGTYTFINVREPHTIKVQSQISQYLITVTGGENGIIIPDTNQTVKQGENISFNFSANAGYHIDKVLIDGSNNQQAVLNGNYTFTNVKENHTIAVTFAVNQFIIDAAADENSSIIPSGRIPVTQGSNKRFDFFPNAGYSIDEVLINNVNNPSAILNKNATFLNIQGNQTIYVKTKPNTYTITPIETINSGGGVITPDTIQTVIAGESKTFIISPAKSSRIKSILVDGIAIVMTEEQTLQPFTYTFTNVTENHTIGAVFESIVNYTETLYNPDCGETNGSIKVFAPDIINDYKCQIDSGPLINMVSGSAVINNLAAGNHVIRIIKTEDNTYSEFRKVILNRNSPLEFNISIKKPKCDGTIPGSIDLEMVNGAGGYMYSLNGNETWTSLHGEVFANIENITQGKYTIIIKDVVNCRYTYHDIIVDCSNDIE